MKTELKESTAEIESEKTPAEDVATLKDKLTKAIKQGWKISFVVFSLINS